jgi:hypothetical protein
MTLSVQYSIVALVGRRGKGANRASAGTVARTAVLRSEATVVLQLMRSSVEGRLRSTEWGSARPVSTDRYR